ncbi:MAG: hypothetical protein WCE62_02010 [Polyangiales bacterium]
MELRRELLLTVGALVSLNLLLAFGSIGLLARMGPAIERILHENVYSIVAAEEMLAEFAESGGAPLSADARHRVKRSFENAKKNVTEPSERPVIDSLERNIEAAMSGDAEARSQVVGDARKIMWINREAMRSVDQEAQRLSSAGAWTTVLVGFISFLLSLFVLMRLQNRFVRPLLDLYQVLESARRGDRLRRCRLTDAPREMIQVTQSVNELLDERLQRGDDTGLRL